MVVLNFPLCRSKFCNLVLGLKYCFEMQHDLYFSYTTEINAAEVSIKEILCI